LPSHPQDDAFHEIQLNGKQLVFLFMAATVVSVVIFLFGVLVGRGVRAERLAMVDPAVTAPADTTPQQPAPTPTPAPAGSDPTAAAPPPAVDDLSYFNRLDKPSPAPEQLKAPPSRATPDVPEHPAPAPPKPAAAPAPAAVAGANDPGERPWAVQVTALNVRTEAEAVAKQLSSKGYEAYVVLPIDGTTMYRVRVGKFKTQREAEPLKARLEKEEQLKPWITR
jgi:septal ring-binding cell division protein DamX